MTSSSWIAPDGQTWVNVKLHPTPTEFVDIQGIMIQEEKDVAAIGWVWKDGQASGYVSWSIGNYVLPQNVIQKVNAKIRDIFDSVSPDAYYTTVVFVRSDVPVAFAEIPSSASPSLTSANGETLLKIRCKHITVLTMHGCVNVDTLFMQRL